MMDVDQMKFIETIADLQIARGRKLIFGKVILNALGWPYEKFHSVCQALEHSSIVWDRLIKNEEGHLNFQYNLTKKGKDILIAAGRNVL